MNKKLLENLHYSAAVDFSSFRTIREDIEELTSPGEISNLNIQIKHVSPFEIGCEAAASAMAILQTLETSEETSDVVFDGITQLSPEDSLLILSRRNPMGLDTILDILGSR